MLTFADLDSLREQGREHAAKHPNAVAEAAAQITDDDLFALICTSGTTGPPKGCMIQNSNYFEMVRSSTLVEQFFLPTDVLLLYLPLAQLRALHASPGGTHRFPHDPRLHAPRPAAVEAVTVRPTSLDGPHVRRATERGGQAGRRSA